MIDQQLRTPLTELTGIKHPVVQTGMGWVAGPRLVSATANAGGLGIIDAIPMMEQDFERPVITSNQATWWATLRELGIKDDLGLGRLFQL